MSDNKGFLVSIVLPTYNGERLINKSIESIISQTYTNWELIIVDDCSTDKTPEIVDSYAKEDNRIKVIHNKINQKLPKSLNIGFSVTKGIYRSWTSDDNQYHKDAIEKMVDFLNCNETIDMVYSNMNLINNDGKFIGDFEAGEPEELRIRSSVGASFLMRDSIMQKVGPYNDSLFLVEDYEYWIRIFLTGKMYHLKETLYDYCMNENGLTAKRKDDILRMTFNVKNMYFNELINSCQNEEDRRRFLIEMSNMMYEFKKQYYRMGYKYSIKKEWKDFKTWIRIAIFHNET